DRSEVLAVHYGRDIYAGRLEPRAMLELRLGGGGAESDMMNRPHPYGPGPEPRHSAQIQHAPGARRGRLETQAVAFLPDLPETHEVGKELGRAAVAVLPDRGAVHTPH